MTQRFITPLLKLEAPLYSSLPNIVPSPASHKIPCATRLFWRLLAAKFVYPAQLSGAGIATNPAHIRVDAMMNRMCFEARPFLPP